MSEEHIPPHDSAFDSETEAALPVRRRRVYPEVAKERLIETTIEMLREQPFDSLTVRSIAERADLNKSTIITYFGSIGRLFMEASNRLALRSFGQFANSAEVMPYEAPDLVLSIRFRAWLLTSGVDPADLRYEPGNELTGLLEQRQRDRFGVSERRRRSSRNSFSSSYKGCTCSGRPTEQMTKPSPSSSSSSCRSTVTSNARRKLSDGPARVRAPNLPTTDSRGTVLPHPMR